MNLLLITNPTASRVTEVGVDRVLDALAVAGDVELARTERGGHATELAAAADADVVIGLGGDGTANEIVNGIRPGMPVGFLPAGATSVFMRQLGYPHDLVAASHVLATAILRGRTRPVGLGRMDGRRFTFAAGFGIDAEAIRLVEEERVRHPDRRRPGDLRVVGAALSVLRREGFTLPERITVEADGRAHRCGYLAVANQHPYTYFGRLPVRVAPRARFESRLDAVAVHALRRQDLWRLPVYGLIWPRHAGGRDRRVGYLHDVDRLVVRCDRPVAVQIDGEYLGRVEGAEISYEPEAITVFTP